MTKQHLYTVGGTVQAGGGIYITRQADEDLLELCRRGTFAYVLTARQLGKSSLMVNTAQRLMDMGVQSVIVDLTELGTQLTAEEWYLGLLTRIGLRLELETNVVEWWQDHAILGVTQRLALFFQQVVLTEVEAPVVVFVDEIDSTLSLDFTDDFFAAIRYLYNTRAVAPQLQRLSFVLLGVATPGDLIDDPKRTPFNIGNRVDLRDFALEEAAPLAEGLGEDATEANQMLSWIHTWTGGHPYLTQRLCSFIANQTYDNGSGADVESAVSEIFCGEMSERDNNLQFVRDMLTKRAPDTTGVLATYRDIRRGRRPVRDEEQSVVKTHLKLSGIVRREQDALRVRNPIYERVFDLQWIKEHWPVNWWSTIPREVKVAGVIIAFMLIALVVISAFALVQQANAEREAEIAFARLLAFQARDNLDSQLDLALLLGADASNRSDIADVKGSLIGALLGSPHLIVFLHDHSDRVESVTFSHDGRLIASGDGTGLVILRDAATHQPLAFLTNEGHYLKSLAFSPDDRYLAAGYADGENRIILWDVNTRQPSGDPLAGHSASVNRVRFGPEGDLLVSGSADGTVRLWDVDTRLPLGEPLQNPGAIESMALSPDGKTLAAGVKGQGIIVLWDIDTRQQLDVLEGHSGTVTSLAFSPDGMTLASGAKDYTMILWDVTTRQPRGDPITRHTHYVYSLAFSPDGRTLASGSWDSSVVLWNIETGQPHGLGLVGHTGKVLSVAFSPDGATLASSGSDNKLILWNVKARQTLAGHTKGVLAVAFSPDGKTLASSSQDGSIILWDTAGWQLRAHLVGDHGQVLGLAFSPDGRVLAAGNEDETVVCWDVASGEELDISSSQGSHVWSVTYSPDGDVLAVGSEDGSVSLWETSAYRPLGDPLEGHTERVFSLAFSPDGRMLASGSADRTIRLWDVNTRQTLGEPLTGHGDWVRSVAFSPDGQTLTSGSHDNSIKIWDANAGQVLSLPFIDHDDHVFSVALSPDGKVLVSSSADRTIRLWDVVTRRELSQPMTGHTDRVNSVAFSPDGRLVASGSDDHTIILWELNRLWDKPTAELRARACAIANRNLSEAEWEQFIGPDSPYQRTCTELPSGKGSSGDQN